MLDLDIEVRILKTGRRGVFALSDFMPSDTIFTWDDSNIVTKEEYATLTPEQRTFVRPLGGALTFMTDPMCYVQHDALHANAGSRRGTVFALKEIHAGEEVTINFEHPDASAIVSA